MLKAITKSRASKAAVVLGSALALTGCGVLQTSPGPSTKTVLKAQTTRVNESIRVVEFDENTASRLQSLERPNMFSDRFPETMTSGTIVDTGDLLAITIWEAPPAALFGGMSSSGLLPANAPSSGVPLPEQVVSSSGTVFVPYVGEVRARGRSGPEIARDITARLRGKANQPQVVVRTIKSGNAAATVVGEVATSARMPLTPQGERVLDALAAGGGVKQPMEKTVIQLTRGDRVYTMPMSTVISDPRQNVVLQPGDIVTAIYKPFSFTVLGASTRNEEVSFEATGISLSQALARAGGLVDNRADPRGVFVFRMERPAALGLEEPLGTPPVLIPVIYRFDLRDPGTFFLAQRFSVRDKDTVYISNGSHVELQRFTQMVGSLLAPAATAAAVLP